MIKANEILIESNTIKDFPFSAVKIAEEFSDICCHSFRYAQAHNIPIYSFGSESAVIVELNGRFILFFDDTKNRCHCRYSILHEFGHLYLGHPIRTTLQPLSLQDKEAYGNYEVEANYFAACLLMPVEKVEKFIRLELNEKEIAKWNGLDIARIQTAFNVSYDMALFRLKALGVLSEQLFEKLKLEKMEITTTKLLKAINGNVDLCKPTEAKKVPAEYLDWAISNYNDKLIPKKSLENALSYVDLDAEDFENPAGDVADEDDLDDLLKEMD